MENQTSSIVQQLSDRNVTLFNAKGLDIPALVKFILDNNGDLPNTNEQLAQAVVNAEIHDREAILFLDVDCITLAALADQLHKENMDKIKARIIVECANAPVTSEADHYLSEKGIIIVPVILANAGGVIVSYYEWLQGRETQFYSEEEVFKLLYNKMKLTMDTILPKFFGDPLPLRQNCYIHSVMKLSTVLYRQGKVWRGGHQIVVLVTVFYSSLDFGHQIALLVTVF